MKRKTRTIRLRTTSAERRAMFAAAAREGLSFAAWARQRLLLAAKKAIGAS